jgi:hypothetical protein
MIRAMTKPKKEATDLTIREVSERYDVPASSVRVWCWQGRFPNAYQEATPRGPVWYIPEADLAGFEKRSVGRPPAAKPKANGKTAKKGKK